MFGIRTHSRFVLATLASCAMTSGAFAQDALPTFVEITADNRGLITLRSNNLLDATTINNTSVQVLTPGPDGNFRTADDVVLASVVSYDAGSRTIEINASIVTDSQYSVFVRGDLVRDEVGVLLDGEFNGVGLATGDGQASGDFEIFIRPPSRMIARFRTQTFRDINVELFPNDTPLTVANFLEYANAGDWDGTFFHRSVPGFIIQGGGFHAVPGFEDVPARSPVLNEPGIPNLRGTIAMAKLGGNPDSATNQWFFSLADNRSTLDDQNGGFTVFGEIIDSAGLIAIDTIESQPTVDASNEDSAFGELPIIDELVFDNRGNLEVEDLVIIDRVSILQDFSGDPVLTFNMDNALVMDAGGDASVMVFDAQGDPLPAGIIDVRFSNRGNIVQSVVLNDSVPTNADIIISIESAAPVQSITDRRRNPRDITLIHSNTAISTIRLNSGIAGANINGVTLPDGTVLSTDIDGDGSGGDNTAIILQSGSVRGIDIRGDVNGDMIIPGGCPSVRVRGDITDCTMLFGMSDGITDLSVTALRAENLRIDTTMRLNQLKLVELQTTSNVSPSSIVCASIGRISTTGNRRTSIDGDFEADITTTASGDSFAMFQLNVAGDIRDADMNFDSSIGRIQARADIIDSIILVAGSFNGGIKTRELRRVDITVDGPMGRLQADQIRGGSLTAHTIRPIKVRGNARDNLDGIFSMDLTLNNPAGLPVACASIQIASDLLDCDITIEGSTNSVKIGGDVRNVNYFQNGDLGQWTANRMENVDLELEGDTRRIVITDWLGGFLEVDNLDLYEVRGDRRNNIPGHLDAGALINRLGQMRVMNEGTLSQSLNIFDCRSIEIDGDLIGSLIQLNNLSAPDQPVIIVANLIVVNGTLSDSFIRTRGALGTVRLGGMRDSGVIVGAPALDTEGFPPLPENVSFNSDIRSISVVNDPSIDRFVNSFIIASEIGDIVVYAPDIGNGFGDEHGISYTTLTGSIRVLIDGEFQTFIQRDGTIKIGDFEIRAFHQAPDIP